MLTAFGSAMVLLAQTADYTSLVAQAKSDLSAGRNTEALAGSQKAIGIDPSRWEAYLIAGSALENQKQFDPAIDNYTKALERAPEAKKAGARSVLEQCMREKLSAAPSPAASATVQSPTFKETLDWLISKNVDEGFTEDVSYPRVMSFSLRFHSEISADPDGRQCVAALTQRGDDQTHQPIRVNFSALAPNSVRLKRINVRVLMPPAEGEQILKFPQEIYFQITGLRPFFTDATEAEIQAMAAVHPEFDFASSPRAPMYSDQDLATRVAKALNHAIDVCGGKGKPEVF
jgi:tetratricopeptide (TPR) repeat protein